MEATERMKRVLDMLGEELRNADKDFNSTADMDHYHDVVTLWETLKTAEMNVYAKVLTKEL